MIPPHNAHARRARSRRGAAGTAAIAIAAMLVAACSSSTRLTDDTLPPLLSDPPSVPAAGATTSTAPASTPAPASTTAPTPVPSTVPTATAPPTTVAPTTGASVAGWGGWAYYEVPRLGTESVRGTGCGGQGGLGDVIPDGVWNVLVKSWSSTQIQVDVRCVYTAEGGQSLWNSTCSAVPDSDPCLSQSPTWFVVNVNTRLRTMPVAAGVQYGVGALGASPCPGAPLDRTSADAAWRFMDSWIVISAGTVTAVIAACPAG